MADPLPILAGGWIDANGGRLGRYVERNVLARAVAWHADDRVLVNENRTIVFS